MNRKTRMLMLAIVLVVGLIAPSSGAVSAAGPTVYGPGQTGCRWYVSKIDGSNQPYGMYVPTSYNPAAPAGVVFSLHGAHSFTSTSFSAFKTGWANTNNAILVNLNGRGTHNYDGVGEEDLFEVLADLKAVYSIDESRLFAEGCSMGGHGAYRWAFRYPGLFAATAASAGWTSYQDFYFKWYASLAEDAGHWGNEPMAPNQNARPPAPGSAQDNAQYADPSRRPLLETASAYYQVENGKYQPIWIGYSSGDPTNMQENALWVINALNTYGYSNYAVNATGGPHCASYNEAQIYSYFTGKTRVTNPKDVVYRTNTLKYNKAYWVQIDRLQYANTWARIATQIPVPNRIEVQADNITQYTLFLNAELVDMGQPVTIVTNGLLTYQGPAKDSITVYAALSPANAIAGWSANNGLPGGLRKTHTLDGPYGHAFQSRFVVVYGTAGTPEQTAQNKADADQFVKEWNYWCMSQGGFGMPGQNPLQAMPDTAVTDETTATSNLRLFGDQNTNSITAQLAAQLPIKFLANGVEVSGRQYSGDLVRYMVTYPNPLNPARYVVVGRGYLTDRLTDYAAEPGGPARWGKNLERLPFDQPDYVVWNDMPRAQMGLTVQKPNGTRFRAITSAYLEAGFFDQNWQLDTTPPVTTLAAEMVEQDGAPAVRVALAAADNVGGFGVAKTEYRVDGGEWTAYSGPFTLSPVLHTVEYRSTDAAGRDVSPRGVVPANVEATQVAKVTYGVSALYDQAKVHKSGSTVPVKIQLTDAGGANVSAAAVTVHVAGLSRVDDAGEQAPEDAGNANPDSDFRYDETLQGYIYNLSSKGLTAGTWQLSFTVLGDPVTHTVQFRVK